MVERLAEGSQCYKTRESKTVKKVWRKLGKFEEDSW